MRCARLTQKGVDVSFRDDFPIYCMLMDEQILALADEIRAARKEPKRGTPTQGPRVEEAGDEEREKVKKRGDCKTRGSIQE